MRPTAAALALALLAGSAGAQTAPTPLVDPVLARGQELAVNYCGGCHAVDRTDPTPNPEAFAFRDLHDRYPVESLAESLAEGIMTGHPDMPQFAFSAEDVTAITAYLNSIQSRPAPPAP